MRKHTCLIYVLFDEQGKVNYVGRTRRKIDLRMNEHKEVLGFRPTFKIIDRCHSDCRNVERRWIEHYRKRGFSLRNINYGQGPHFLSPEAKQKLSIRLTGVPKSAETRRKMSEAQKGRPKNWSRSGYARVRKSQFKPGRTWTPEQKAVIVAKAIERAKFPETAAILMAGRLKALDPEVRERAGKSISAALKKHPRRTRRIALNASKAAVSKVKQFWAELCKDPKRYQQFIQEREAKRCAARYKKEEI